MTDQPKTCECGQTRPHPTRSYMLGCQVLWCPGQVKSPPTLRTVALAAARQAIRDGQWWLPPAGQQQIVDAVLALHETDLAARLEQTLTDVDHHNTAATTSAQTHPDVPELAAAHSGMAAGLHIAAAHIARGNPELVARVKERIDQGDQAAPPAEHCGDQLPRIGSDTFTECVLHPGHHGSHADHEENRWTRRQSAGYCPHCGRGDAGPSPEAYEEMRQRAEQLEVDLAESRGQVERVRKALAERRAEVADYETERPASAWSDAVTVTCNRIDDALRVFPPPIGIRVDSALEQPVEFIDPNPTIPSINPTI